MTYKMSHKDRFDMIVSWVANAKEELDILAEDHPYLGDLDIYMQISRRLTAAVETLASMREDI